jgi:hypothetical protein
VATLINVEDLRKAIKVTETYSPERLPQILAGVEGWVAGEICRQLTPLPPLVPVEGSDPPTVADTADPVVHEAFVNGSRWIRVPDAREITRVEIDGREITGYVLHSHRFPANGPVTHVEIFVRGRVARVTGRFGFVELPEELREAIIATAAHRVAKESTGHVDVRSDEYGSRQWSKRIPSEARMVFTNYTVPSDVIGYR